MPTLCVRTLIRRWFAGLATAFAAAGIASIASAAMRFRTEYQTFPSAPSVSQVRALDVDGDGIRDLVVSGASAAIWIHRGLPGGGYAPAAPLVTFPDMVGPWDLGDIDNDGRIDMVAADKSQMAWSLLGNGDGTFQAPRAFLSLFTGASLKLADLDGDGRLDIVATVPLGPLYTMKGLGDGRFQLTSVMPPPTAFPDQVGVADLDGDSRPDVVATDFVANVVDLYRGLPNGLLDAPVAIPVPGAPRFVTTGDFDEDGRPDALVISFGTTNTLSFFYGVPAGTPLGRVDLPRDGANSVSFVDIDGDRHPDLLTAERAQVGDQVAVLGRTGPRSYAPWGDFAAGIEPLNPVYTDADGDGHPDIVVCNPLRSELVVQHGHGGVTFGDGEEMRTFIMAGLDVGDVNGDHVPDLVTMRSGTASMAAVHLGTGDGTFQPMIPTDPACCFGYTAGRLVDMDGDGHLDIVGTTIIVDSLNVLRGDGKGHFALASAEGLGADPGGSIALADFDGDHRPDAAVATRRGIGISLGTAAGGLAAPQYLLGRQGVVVTADLDHDGKADLVACDSESELGSQIQVYLGRGDGKFTKLPTFTGGNVPFAIGVGDANADGFADLAIANKGDHNIALFFGNGDGTFAAGPVIPDGSSAAVELADLDGDGICDLITASRDSACVSVWPGTGSGVFGPRLSFGTRSYPDLLQVKDLNHDGMPDLVVGHLYRDVVDVLLNQTPIPLGVASHADVALAIRSCRWDPSASAFNVRVSLANSSSARLQIVDVLGRIVADERWAPSGPDEQGRRVAVATHPASGVYWARLSQEGRVAVGRVVVIQ
jgi:hypothetical protein